MKHLVETKGAFMFLDPETGTEIHATRPTVVLSNNFIEGRVALGQLKILSANISDKATDEEFLEYWKESQEIAVESFLSKYGTADEDEEDEVVLSDELVAELKLAVETLEEGDFQQDGKPKVGPLNKLVEGAKITSDIRDAFWAIQ